MGISKLSEYPFEGSPSLFLSLFSHIGIFNQLVWLGMIDLMDSFQGWQDLQIIETQKDQSIDFTLIPLA